MTIRQLAETAGCGMSTVKRVGKMLYPNVKSVGRGIALDYDREQSIAIMNKLPKKEYIADPNIGHLTQVKATAKSDNIDYEKLSKVVASAVASAVLPLMEMALKSIHPDVNKLLEPQTKQDRDSLRQLVGQYAKDKCLNDYQKAWHVLYEEIYYRLKINVKVRAKNEGIKAIDYLDREDLIPQCCAIMREYI